MKITRVIAPAFGPFTDQQLEFPAGLTVVWGLNEAGKSSWHSALYLALCGFRRAQGRGLETDRDLTARHKPWSGGPWRVGADVELDDGQSLTITWDLKTKTAKVTDNRGRDCSAKWITAGAADLARIVGLDRASFLATACIRQSDVLAVSEDPEKLQEFLQRAAATGGVDQTAASALATIDRFRQERVGADRSNSTKPLAVGKRSVAAAEAALREAQVAHGDWLQLTESIEETSNRLTVLGARLAASRACLDFAQAAQSRREATAVHEAVANLRAQLASLQQEQAEHRSAIEVFDARLAVLDCEDALGSAKAAHQTVTTLLLRRDALLEQERELASEAACLQAASQHALALASALGARTAQLAAKNARAQLESALVDRRRAEDELTLAQEVHLRTVAARLRHEADHIVALSARVPTEPEALVRQDQLTQRVHTAIERWRARPSVPDAESTTAAELRQKLEALPEPPVGDTQPRVSVIEAEARFDLAKESLRSHLDRRPPMPPPLFVAASATVPALERLASRLTASGEPPETVERLLDAARSRATPDGAARTHLIGAGVLVVGGALIAVLGFLPGLALAIAGAVWLVLALRRRPTPDPLLRDVVLLEQRLEDAREFARQRAEAENDARSFGITPTAHAAQEAAAAVAQHAALKEQVTAWQQAADAVRSALGDAADALSDALDDAGALAAEDLPATLDRYRSDCEERARTAAAARARPGLLAELRIEESRESDRERAREQVSDLEAALRAAASETGVAVHGDPDSVAVAMTQWLSDSEKRAQEAQRVRDQWSELQTLLAGRSVEEVIDLATEAESKAVALRKSVVERALTKIESGDRSEHELADVASELSTSLDVASAAVTRAETSLSERNVDPVEIDRAETALANASEVLNSFATDRADEYSGLSAELATRRLDQTNTELVAVRSEAAEIAGQAQERQLALGDLMALADALDQANVTLQLAMERRRHSKEESIDALDRRSANEARNKHQQLLDLAVLNANTSAGALAERQANLPDVAGLKLLEGEARSRMLASLGPDGGPQLGIDPASLPTTDELGRDIAGAEAEIIELRELLASTRGQRDERAQHSADPSSAAESLAIAKTEYDRVRRLDQVLTTTRLFLHEAQDRVHRDIAPRIHAAADPRMPDVFGDRYERVLVDPQTLHVQVRTSSGDIREASLLSHGTAEQIYLILRLALVDVLTAASSETCPVVLDDVTVNFDSERKRSILDMLHSASADRQVILFSQEDFVRDWAASALTSKSDRLVLLDGRASV